MPYADPTVRAAYQAAYRKANRDRLAARQAERRQENWEAVAAYQATYQATYPYEKKAAAKATWVAANSDKVRANYRVRDCRRRARKAILRCEPYLAVEVFERDGYQCYLCDVIVDPTVSPYHQKYPTIDHVHPLSKGGDDILSNIRTACRRCNTRKGSKSLAEWRLYGPRATRPALTGDDAI